MWYEYIKIGVDKIGPPEDQKSRVSAIGYEFKSIYKACSPAAPHYRLETKDQDQNQGVIT